MTREKIIAFENDLSDLATEMLSMEDFVLLSNLLSGKE